MESISSLSDIKAHVWQSYNAGHTIELDHCVYGPSTGSNVRGYIDETMSYYRLLAGHCMLTDAGTVIEVGTHYGGSALALLAGMRGGKAETPQLVTMDVTDLSTPQLMQEPEIRTVIGDSTIHGFMASLVDDLDDTPVDLLYIDALKDAAFVITTLFNAHSVNVAPTWLILDDVQANDSMRSLWTLLEEMEPDMAFLISRDYPEIRRPDMGYGIIYLPGTDSLLERCEEMMDRLDLDSSGLWRVEDESLLARAGDAGTGVYYQRRASDGRFREGNRIDLSTCYDLACDHYQGRGDIVEFGSLVGPTTRALAKGLANNQRVEQKQARITTCGDFTYNLDSQKNAIADRVPFGASTLPIVTDAVSAHLDLVNIVDMASNRVRWCGRPIELLVLAGIHTPQINAHTLAEFVPHMPVGESIIYHREYARPYRPWVSFVYAYLKDNFQILKYLNGAAILRYTKAVSKSDISKIVENRFTTDERVELIEAFIGAQTDLALKWDLHLQVCIIQLNTGELAEASQRLADLHGSIDQVHTKSRESRLLKATTRMSTMSTARSQ